MGTTRNNVNSVHVTSGINKTSESTLSIGNITNGDVAVINADTGSVIKTSSEASALSDNQMFKIISGLSKGAIRHSMPFSRNTLSDATAKKYAPGLDQVSFIGYNGVDGTLPSKTSTDYRMDVEIKHRQRIRGEKIGGDSIFITTPTEGASAIGTAMQFAELFDMKKQNGTDKEYGTKYVSLDVIASTAVPADDLLSVDNQATVVKGSPIIVFASAATHSSGSLISINDPIQIGGTNESSVYIVEKVDALSITLNRVVRGDSAVVTASNIKVLTSITNVGLKLTGLPQDEWNGIDTFEWLKFTTRMREGDNYSGAPEVIVRTPISAYPGIGVYGQVKDAEYFAEGNEGVNSRTKWYDSAINPDSLVIEGAEYHVVTIQFLNEADDQFQNRRSFPCKANVFIKTGAGATPVDGEQAFNSGNEFLSILSAATGKALTVQA